jgi:cell shape-determining protein MreC
LCHKIIVEQLNDEDMMTEVIIALVGLFCTIVGSVVTFLLTKRKYNSEVDSQVIQNLNSGFDTYKITMENTLELHNKKIKMLEKENEELRAQVNQLQQQLTSLLLMKFQSTKIEEPDN